jgi:hypothetical protein
MVFRVNLGGLAECKERKRLKFGKTAKRGS